MPDNPTSPSATDAIKAAPFLKWAGGKGQLLEQYQPFFPQEPFAAYYEPFVGSAAVFFHLQGEGLLKRSYLSDANEELVNVFQVVRDDVESLIGLLAEHRDQHGEEHYYAVREMDRRDLPADAYTPLVRAARMIYLNKTCYNGLWRVNSKGHFNVPMGRYRNPAILDESRLRAASQALQNVELAARDFREATAEAGKGDFVYFDPPYVPLSETANFTSYAKLDFGEAEQRALADTFRDLDRRGCRVMLSNSEVPLVRELYEGYEIAIVRARRAINVNPARRGRINELVVRNYQSPK